MALLSDHLADGLLTQSEFNDRLGLLLSARTNADIEPLFVDLPGPNPGRPADLESLVEQDRRETNELLAHTRAERRVAKADPRLIASLAVAVGVGWTAAVIAYFTLYDDWKIFIVPIALSIALAFLKRQSTDHRA